MYDDDDIIIPLESVIVLPGWAMYKMIGSILKNEFLGIIKKWKKLN